MTPEQIAAVTALVGILERISTLPFGVLLFCIVVGPWILSISLFFAERKRFERVVAMYETNVVLVRNYEKLADDQKDVITLNTQAWIGVRDAIDRNEFCPVVRGKRVSHQSIQYDTDKREGD